MMDEPREEGWQYEESGGFWYYEELEEEEHK
jgi:hypothetical protein